MNNLTSLVKMQKKLENELKAKEEEQGKLENELEDQRKIKNNIIQKQREVKMDYLMLKMPLFPQSIVDPGVTFMKSFVRISLIGIATMLFTYGPLANFFHTTNTINTIISILIFTPLAFISQSIASKRYKKKIRNKLIKAFQTNNIEDINNKLENELEETIKHQRILNQKKYRVEKEINCLQKEIRDNKNKMYNQVIPNSTKETDKNDQQEQLGKQAKTLKRTRGLN